jgi:ferritin
MIGKKMAAAINGQIRNEMYSANLYLQMAAYSTYKNLSGIAHWFTIQYHEEMFHAMKFFTYLNNQGMQVELGAIEKPPVEFGTPLEMFEMVLAHELKITKNIYDLVDLAMAEKDRPTGVLLNWYVMEQVEEENNDNEIIAQLKMIKDDPNGLYALDQKLGTRVLGVPSDYSAAASAVALKSVSA